jgi:Flp pilus assembly protein TadD
MNTTIIKLLIISLCLPVLLVAQNNPISTANAMAEQGRYAEALTELNSAIANEPNSARAYKIRGHVYIAQGDHQKALADLSKVIALTPHQAKPYVDRAIVHYKMGNKGLALSDISAAQRIAPTDSWVAAVREKISSENL